MKSDIFHAYDPTSVRESTLGVRITRPISTIMDFAEANSPELGYKLPFSIDSRPFLTIEGQHSQQMRHLNGEGTGRLFIGEAHPNQLRTQETAPSSTFCRACPQYGHVLIFPRKCYYEAQCPLPLLFCANDQHGEKAVRTSINKPRISHQNLVHSFLRHLSSTISKRIAYNDPTRENTNFGWRRRQ